MAAKADEKMEEQILRKLHEYPGHEAILVPSQFAPPIMLSNIFRIGCQLKRKGFTSQPDRRMGGWHMKLTPQGVSFCQDSKPK